MIYRFATQKDSKELAKIHIKAAKKQIGSFIHLLGEYFWFNYYHNILNYRHFVVLVAEDNNKIVGFVSGTLSVQDHVEYLKKIKYKLAIALLPKLFQKPKLFTEIIKRYKFINENENTNTPQFRIRTGVRMEYWAWSTEETTHLSIQLLRIWIKIVHTLGYSSIKGEVDKENKNVYEIHKVLGAKFLYDLDTKDGRKRVVFEYIKNSANPVEPTPKTSDLKPHAKG